MITASAVSDDLFIVKEADFGTSGKCLVTVYHRVKIRKIHLDYQRVGTWLQYCGSLILSSFPDGNMTEFPDTGWQEAIYEVNRMRELVGKAADLLKNCVV